MLSIIVALTENNVIGRDGDMPWRLSADLRRYKRITMGHHMIMGRKTFDSIGRALPGRTSVVISRTAAYDDPLIRVARSWDEALQIAADDEEIFIVGGGQIFELSLSQSQVDRLYLTRVHCSIEGDTFFPDIQWDQWKLVDEERHQADEKNNYDYSFLTFDRK